jgi:tripartite-type tricarboxylate transporter receptor subunit TctC
MHKPKVNLFVTALLTTMGLLIAPMSSAQNVSDKPLRIIVPQPPGGGFDFVGRVLADKMAPLIGQSIMVENKTGAGTVVGTDYVANFRLMDQLL